MMDQIRSNMLANTSREAPYHSSSAAPSVSRAISAVCRAAEVLLRICSLPLVEAAEHRALSCLRVCKKTRMVHAYRTASA